MAIPGSTSYSLMKILRHQKAISGFENCWKKVIFTIWNVILFFLRETRVTRPPCWMLAMYFEPLRWDFDRLTGFLTICPCPTLLMDLPRPEGPTDDVTDSLNGSIFTLEVLDGPLLFRLFPLFCVLLLWCSAACPGVGIPAADWSQPVCPGWILVADWCRFPEPVSDWLVAAVLDDSWCSFLVLGGRRGGGEGRGEMVVGRDVTGLSPIIRVLIIQIVSKRKSEGEREDIWWERSRLWELYLKQRNRYNRQNLKIVRSRLQ